MCIYTPMNWNKKKNVSLIMLWIKENLTFESIQELVVHTHLYILTPFCITADDINSTLQSQFKRWHQTG